MKRLFISFLCLILALLMFFSMPVQAASLSEEEAAMAGFDVYRAWHTLNYTGYDFYAYTWSSPYRIIVDTYSDNVGWNTSLTLWRIVTFDLKSEIEHSQKELGYYEALLFNILYDEGSETLVTSFMGDSVSDLTKTYKSLGASALKSLAKTVDGSVIDNSLSALSQSEKEELLAVITNIDEIKDACELIGDVTKLLEC